MVALTLDLSSDRDSDDSVWMMDGEEITYLFVSLMPKKKQTLVSNNGFSEFLLYTTPNGKVTLEVFLEDENIWLTQAKIAELF